MRRIRVLKLALVLALGFLFIIVSLNPPRQNAHLNLALDDVLTRFLDHLPTSVSAQAIRAVQESLESLEPPKSPRDFQVPEKNPSSSHITKACTLLRAKRILLIGPETTYYLHSLWLNALEIHEQRIHQCPGPEFCSFHHICLPSDYATPHDRFKLPPKYPELVASGSAVMRYVLSTSLYAAKDKNDAGYTEAVVDPATGVRLKNACWLYKARKADIVLMNRGPIPAPAWTYAGHNSLGNWSFTSDFPRHLGPGKTLATEIVNAAFHATVTRFIPEVLQSLHALQMDPLTRNKPLVWHPSWFSGSVDFEKNDLARKVDDPWALYYNAQVYMQNYLLRILLPHYGVYFLPRIAPSRILADSPPADPGPQDTLRFPLGTPNAQAMETVFLKSLTELLERAN
ncbi:hypothetical protein FB451DRAFT_1019241 [Mycena latifolia]|nr:hypothetical protein FB451DRAFT_1019241 [Mycena latifolia]